MSAILEHLQNPDALWTIAAGCLCSVPCAILGCYLVLRRMSLLGDAISHSVLPGIAIAFLVSGQRTELPIMIGAMALGVLTSFITQLLHTWGNVPEDSSMGVTFTSLFALGVILITRAAAQSHIDADCIFYGLIEMVALDTAPVFGLEVPRMILPLLIALVTTIVFAVSLRKELTIVSFDPALATAMGINATLVHYLLMAMVATVTVASFEAVGSILVIAMLIVPGATAHLLTDRMGWMFFWAIAVAVVSAVGGYLAAASELNTSVAGMMAVVAGVQFAAAVLFAPRHGVISKWLHNAALAVRIGAEDLLATLYREEELQVDPHRSPLPVSALLDLGSGPIAWAAVAHSLKRGEIKLEGGRVVLAPAGRTAAESIVRSHRLWELYLDQNFELPADHLHEPASRVEHFITPDLQEELARDLAEPGTDPHGRAIPPPAPHIDHT